MSTLTDQILAAASSLLTNGSRSDDEADVVVASGPTGLRDAVRELGPQNFGADWLGGSKGRSLAEPKLSASDARSRAIVMRLGNGDVVIVARLRPSSPRSGVLDEQQPPQQ